MTGHPSKQAIASELWREVERIQALFDERDGDAEDVISYARHVIDLREKALSTPSSRMMKMPQIDYSKIKNSKLATILRDAEALHDRLAEAGDSRGATSIQRLIVSRIAANAENKRVNREYRELLEATKA